MCIRDSNAEYMGELFKQDVHNKSKQTTTSSNHSRSSRITYMSHKKVPGLEMKNLTTPLISKENIDKADVASPLVQVTPRDDFPPSTLKDKPTSQAAPELSVSSPTAAPTPTPTQDPRIALIFKKLDEVYARHRNKASIYYILASVCVFSVMGIFYRAALTYIPPIQLIFVTFLVIFLINYYVIRCSPTILPYIETEEESFHSKLSGFFGLFSIVCLYYSMKFIDQDSAIFLWLTSPLTAIAIEVAIYHERYTHREMVLVCGAVLGSLFILKPPIFGLAKLKTPQPSPLLGFFIGLIGSVAAAFVIVTFKRLKDCHFVTINHVFSMIIVLFLPIFFPMQGLIRPGLLEWLVMIIYGVLGLVAFSLYIRSFQLEKSGKLQALASTFLISFVVIDMVHGGKLTGTLCAFGACVLGFCSYQLILETGENIHSENSFIFSPTKERHEVPMKTFTKSTKGIDMP
eukprot:TRINITY_DN3105_c0_g1_i22.p1 TRINITY_DN3105_c0_g1~~TRINITY_DN3105_c0_g1_i22.p1  ORF type:complete len:459 (+),score=86.24 TRINITY_DN3105_c0_g1_i22:60-1436(+)